MAKLTKTEVKQIKHLLMAGKKTYDEIGKKYEVSSGLIGHIATDRAGKKVEVAGWKAFLATRNQWKPARKKAFSVTRSKIEKAKRALQEKRTKMKKVRDARSKRKGSAKPAAAAAAA